MFCFDFAGADPRCQVCLLLSRKSISCRDAKALYLLIRSAELSRKDLSLHIRSIRT